MQYLLERAPELVLLKDNKYGGTALHWATTVEVVDALLEAGCNLDVLSDTGESAIHVALRYDRQHIIHALVAFAAELNVVSPEWGAPIHMVSSFAKPNRSLLVTFIAYGCNFDITDIKGHSARHMAAVGAQPPPEDDQSQTSASVRLTNAFYSLLKGDDDDKKKRDECDNIVALLNVVGAKRCPEGTQDCAPGCKANGTYNGQMPVGFPQFPIMDPSQSECPAAQLIDRILADNSIAAYGTNPDDYKNRLRMLCLDGGGVRGLMTTMILRYIEEQVGIPISECFDVISGTSVGGLIALFLVYGQPFGFPGSPYSYDPLRNMQRLAYFLRRKVFVGSRPYSTTQLENLLKKGFGEDTLLSSATHPMVMVTSVLANRFPAELVMFRNYSSAVELYEQAHPELKREALSPAPSLNQLHHSASEPTSPQRAASPQPSTASLHLNQPAGTPNNQQSSPQATPSAPDDFKLVWKAARSTGAAPTYFRSSGNFIDGGVMANNPTLDAMTDVHQLAAVGQALGFGDDFYQRYRVGLVLSIGTGREKQQSCPVADLRRPEGIMEGLSLYKSVLSFINLLVDQATVADGRPVRVIFLHST